jgi:hypothetical protein
MNNQALLRSTCFCSLYTIESGFIKGGHMGCQPQKFLVEMLESELFSKTAKLAQ